MSHAVAPDEAGDSTSPVEYASGEEPPVDRGTNITNAEDNGHQAKSTTSSERLGASGNPSTQVNGDHETKDDSGVGRERPKVLIARNIERAIFHLILFHAIPFAGSITLIALNFKTRYLGGYTPWISGLQYVAKVHEMFMLASIALIVATYMQHLLVHTKGVPFGALFSAYELPQMTYLFSREFLGALTATAFSGPVRIGFILFVPFSTLLGAFVGPSSAIAMQPRLVRYPSTGAHLALNTTRRTLFPDSFNSPLPPLQRNTSDEIYSHSILDVSPVEGWEGLFNVPTIGSEATREAGLQITAPVENSYMPAVYSTQILVPSGAARSLRTLYLQYAPNSTFATIQHVILPNYLTEAAVTAAYEGGTLLDDEGIVAEAVAQIELRQPFVSVYCTSNRIEGGNDTRPFEFPDVYVAGCGDGCSRAVPRQSNKAGTIPYTSVTREEIWRRATPRAEGRILWIDDLSLPGAMPAHVLGAIVVQPQTCGPADVLVTSACTVGATWVNLQSFARSPQSSSARTPNVPVENDLTRDSFLELPDWSLPSLNLSKQWAESLNPSTRFKNRTVADNLLRSMSALQDACPFTGRLSTSSSSSSAASASSHIVQRPHLHESLLASLLAMGLSVPPHPLQLWGGNPSEGWYWTDPSTSSQRVRSGNDPPGLVLAFTSYLPGYAWTLDEPPIKLALTILLTYCTYVVAFAVASCAAGRSSVAWCSISGLTALAVNSRPTGRLRHTSAGVGRTSTFRNLVSVREVVGEKGETLELAFEDDEGIEGVRRRPTTGKAY